ncbi:MAG: hypothetical protein H6713_38865 [Myxococcales bacterium]|nr:hypothetical protein [Myxococcales bacterium]
MEETDPVRVAALERELAALRAERDALRGLLRALQPSVADMYARLDAAVELAAASGDALRRRSERPPGPAEELVELGRRSESSKRVIDDSIKASHLLSRDINALIRLADQPNATNDALGDRVSALSYSLEELARSMSEVSGSNEELGELIRVAVADARGRDAELDDLRDQLDGFRERVAALARRRDVMKAQLSEVARASVGAPTGRPDTSELAVALTGAVTRTTLLTTQLRARDETLASLRASIVARARAILDEEDELFIQLFAVASTSMEMKVAVEEQADGAAQLNALRRVRELTAQLERVIRGLERSCVTMTREGRLLARLEREVSEAKARDASETAYELRSQLEALARALSPAR